MKYWSFKIVAVVCWLRKNLCSKALIKQLVIVYVWHGVQSVYERERERASSIIWITDYWQLYGIRFFIYYNMQNTRNNLKKEFNMQNNLV